MNQVQEKIKDQAKSLQQLSQINPQKTTPQEANQRVNNATQNASQVHMRFQMLSGKGFDAQLFLKLIEEFSEEGKSALYFVEDDKIRSQVVLKLSFIIKTTYALVTMYNKNGCVDNQTTASLKVKFYFILFFHFHFHLFN